MTAWCLLLIAQGSLIRFNRRSLHKLLGTTSFVLVPIIVITTVQFIHFRLQGAGELPDVALYVLALIINALIVFVALFGLAIRCCSHSRSGIGGQNGVSPYFRSHSACYSPITFPC
jgi:hypothetical protein